MISFSFCFSFGCTLAHALLLFKEDFQLSQISKKDENGISGKTFLKFPNKDVITPISSLKHRKKWIGRGVHVPDRARLKFVQPYRKAWSIWANLYTSLW